MTPPFSGAVLTGGRSRRMGTDKAFVEVDGRPMAGRAADALREAGAREVLAIGGEGERLRALGLTPHPDSHPGAGPLGAIVDALTVATHDTVVVLACDQPWVSPSLVRRLVDRGREAVDAVVPVVEGRVQPLCALYTTRAHAHLTDCFEAGERSPTRALDGLRWLALRDVPAGLLRDVDDPGDLARYAAPEPRPVRAEDRGADEHDER